MRCKGIRNRRGISLLECLMLVTVLGIMGAGAGQALISITKVPGQTNTTLDNETHLVSKMEQLRAMNYDALTIGTAVDEFSDNNMMVDIAYADPHGGLNYSLFWKQITVRNADGRQLTMMVSKP
jgi:hypothetical protein